MFNLVWPGTVANGLTLFNVAIDSYTSYDVFVLHREVPSMKMVRLNVQLPITLKSRIDAERKRGTSAAGLIRHLLEQYFKGKKAA